MSDFMNRPREENFKFYVWSKQSGVPDLGTRNEGRIRETLALEKHLCLITDRTR